MNVGSENCNDKFGKIDRNYFLKRSHFIIMYLSPNSVITRPEPFKFSSFDMYSMSSFCLKTLYTG